jgi:hypothetical protein
MEYREVIPVTLNAVIEDLNRELRDLSIDSAAVEEEEVTTQLEAYLLERLGRLEDKAELVVFEWHRALREDA